MPVVLYACVVWVVSERLLVKEDPGLYHFINQGCLGVDGMDDREEMKLVDVCIGKKTRYTFRRQQNTAIIGYQTLAIFKMVT